MLLAKSNDIRQEIYKHVAVDHPVKFVAGIFKSKKHMSPCASLLVSCKQINAEFRPIFSQEAHIDISGCIIDKKNFMHEVGRSIEVGAVKHLKINPSTLSGTEVLSLIKTMTKLESLTFQQFGGHLDYYLAGDLVNDELEHHDCCSCTCVLNPRAATYSAAFRCLADEIIERPNTLVGKCQCDEEPYVGLECCENDAFRKVIVVWQYLGQPFQLMTEVPVNCSDMPKEYQDIVSALEGQPIGLLLTHLKQGLFNLGSKMMKLTGGKRSYEFKVDLSDY